MGLLHEEIINGYCLVIAGPFDTVYCCKQANLFVQIK